jgi:heme-degrading monooxygenase HmoA
MIARVWKGKTKIEHSEIYKKIIEERDIPDYSKTKGFLKRADKEYTYFKLITFWQDLEIIKNFTGPDFEEAVAYKEDEKYLIDFPGRVLHYEVFAE